MIKRIIKFEKCCRYSSGICFSQILFQILCAFVVVVVVVVVVDVVFVFVVADVDVVVVDDVDVNVNVNVVVDYVDIDVVVVVVVDDVDVVVVVSSYSGSLQTGVHSISHRVAVALKKKHKQVNKDR